MSDLFLRFPRLPHLPDYKTPQNQADEEANIKKYREDLHRALQEGIATTDVEIGPSSPTTANITATTPIVVTPSPLTSIGVISINTFGASGGSHARGAVPDPGAGAGTTKFLREDATWDVPPGGSSPLTTKGDVWGFSTVDARIPIGTDAYVLTADSAQTLGLKWAPVPTSGVLQSQEFTASGTWTQPSGVTSVWVSMIGGGGGGSSTILAATGGGGGGAGELVQNMAVAVSGNVTVTVGAKGTGGAAGQASAQVGVAGGDTSFGSQYIARGGKGGATSGASGAGGGANAGAVKAAGNPGGSGVLGTQSAPTYFGGSSGGGGGATTPSAGGSGAPAPGYPTGSAAGTAASSQAGGGGGANSLYGVGGAGGNGGAIGSSAASTSYGSGGGGGGGKATTTIGGGDGCAGYVLVQWVG